MEKRLKRPPVGLGTVRLSDVLAHHRRHAVSDETESLEHNIGDGYLCATNAVYRNVRAEVLRRGFRFTHEGAVDYHAFPLMSLDRLLDEKKLPYLDNVAWLETLERRSPGRFALADVQRMALSSNYLIHESAHGIAHAVLASPRFIAESGTESSTASDTESVRLLRELVGEAFANAVEVLSWAFVTGELGAYFLSVNTHFVLEPSGIAVVLRSLHDQRAAVTLKALLYSFLYSNFLYARLDADELATISAASAYPLGDGLAELCAIGLELSEVFRADTSILYLAHQGYSDDALATLDHDPTGHLSDLMKRAVDELVALVTAGVDAEFGLETFVRPR